MKPLFTIATVTYNAEATLERTLRSVASQDYARIEHLIIDGCSTDHTLALVQHYVEENQARHNIRLICEPDDGLYDAMNKALLCAAGDYIVFLNAGDCLHSTDTISAIAEAMSCGTPCVGFDVGGIPEMIDHLKNGYVARYRDAADLAEGIRFVLGHNLRAAAHSKAAETYNETKVAKEYIKLFSS